MKEKLDEESRRALCDEETVDALYPQAEAFIDFVRALLGK